MKRFPVVTKDRQKLYEKIFTKATFFQNEMPEICGFYGRACRRMDSEADRRLCSNCSLALFVSVVEAIIERCNEKEAKGFERLYDSDIYDIQNNLKEKGIKVQFAYIESLLDCIVDDEFQDQAE